jgi:GNAT superfamily N-acetyltransferase
LDDVLGVVGFYTLSSSAIILTDLPLELSRRLPKYPQVPAALIGRLARDLRVRNQGIGELLLIDALRRVELESRSIGIFAVRIDAKDDGAIQFYKRFGFESYPSNPRRLFIPMTTVRDAIIASNQT